MRALAASRVGTDFEIGAQIASRAQRIFRTGNVGMKTCSVALDWNSNAAFAKFIAAGARSAEAERSLTSLQIWNAHTRKQIRRKIFPGEKSPEPE